MASRKSKNEELKKVIAGVKGEEFVPKAPRNKRKGVQAPPKEAIRWGKPYVPQTSTPYITGEGNSDGVSVSRNHNCNTRTVGDVTPTKFIKGKHGPSKKVRKSPKAKFTWQERDEMKTVALVAAREDRLAAKKARRNVRPVEGTVIKHKYLPHTEYQLELAKSAA